MTKHLVAALLAAPALAALASPTLAKAPPADPPVTPMTPDVAKPYDEALPEADFVRREAMVPMRDGVKLYTVIVFKKGTQNGPILLSRTPYDAHGSANRSQSQHIADVVEVMDKEFVEDGYIRVYQDIRGLHRSEGQFIMNRPLSGPLNSTKIDESTDAYDTVEWLVKHVKNNNGKAAETGTENQPNLRTQRGALQHRLCRCFREFELIIHRH